MSFNKQDLIDIVTDIIRDYDLSSEERLVIEVDYATDDVRVWAWLDYPSTLQYGGAYGESNLDFYAIADVNDDTIEAACEYFEERYSDYCFQSEDEEDEYYLG